MLSACSSLIAIVNVNGTQVIQFAHFSVREILTSNRRLSSPAGGNLSSYHVPLVHAHTVLTRACLSVLLSFDVILNTLLRLARLWASQQGLAAMHAIPL